MTDDNSVQDAVVIERSFDAPVQLIWQLWTDPEHFKAWYGPDGATIPVATMDVRVGGTRLVAMEMQTPGGPMRMWFTGEYREVVENERLVYTESMCDGHGNVVSPADMGMPAGHPTTTEIRVQLQDVDGRTKMVMTHAGLPGDSPGAAGWAMAFDKLAAHVKARNIPSASAGERPMADRSQTPGEDRFWALAAPLLGQPSVTRSTMMGFACLRLDGDFFASCDHRTGSLVVKLNEQRVSTLVDSGTADPFAPSGRPFREWASIPFERRRGLGPLLDEALELAAIRKSTPSPSARGRGRR